jgi:hypothetical protein
MAIPIVARIRTPKTCRRKRLRHDVGARQFGQRLAPTYTRLPQERQTVKADGMT